MTYFDKKTNPLPEDWHWEECARCKIRWMICGPDSTAVSANIGENGIEVHVFPHPPDMEGSDPTHHDVPWKVLLVAKDRAISEARSLKEELIARADDLRPEYDRFVNGDRVRYIGNAKHIAEMRRILRRDDWEDKNVGATGTVTGFSTPKHGYEHVKWQQLLVTWDEGSPRPGITIEGRETMVDSTELEALEVH